MKLFGSLLTTVYAGVAYLSFVAAALWAAGFLADTGAVVPTTVDGGGAVGTGAAIAVDATLLLVFAVQHTVMARAGFKNWLVRKLPAAAERSTYVLASSIALGLIFGLWQPVSARIWDVSGVGWAAAPIWTVYLIGWLITVASTFMIDHWDFLGLRQARWRGRGPYEPPPFKERWFYAWLRHPMMLGLLVTFWATPRMTVGHLVFALAGSGYIAVGIRFEERDLRRHLGDAYREYATRVPALLPRRP